MEGKKTSASKNNTGQKAPKVHARKTIKTVSPQSMKKSKPKKSNPKSKPKKSGQKPLWRRVAYGFAVASVWGAILGIIGLIYLAHDLPDLDNLPAPGATDRAVVVKSASGATLVRSGPVYGDWIPYGQTPKTLINAFLAIEDQHFFQHSGIDIRGLVRAVIANVKAGSVRAGGSTITQQLAKNMFLSPARTVTRKAQELLLAFWLEQKFTKQQILSLYLNRVYFGGGAYGIDAASHKFFGHSARTLSVAESAILAGLVKAPSRYAPHINPEGAWQRAHIVIGAMVRSGMMTATAASKTKSQPPNIVQDGIGAHVRYYTDWVQSEALRIYPESRGRSIIIYSTLDPGMQRAAMLAIKRGLDGEGKKRGASEAALVSMDLDGAVRAMIGGSHYGRSQFNRAVQAKRQPGSAFKLFSYLAALEMGIKPGDIYTDQKIEIDGWSPKNYNGQYNGDMTVREAMTRSINTVAVQVAERAGRTRVAAMANRMGISTTVEPLASLPLGTEEVRLLDLTSSYSAVGNGGFAATAYGVLEITTMEGQVLYRRTAPRPIAVLAYPAVKDMTNMLGDVIAGGSGRNAQLDRPAAGKTGTSQDSRDAVFVGFTSDISTAVWVGNDDGTPMKAVTGSGMPARIWRDFMLEAHVGAPKRDLLADAGLYSASASDSPYEHPLTQSRKRQEQKKPKKKKKSLLERIFGSN